MGERTLRRLLRALAPGQELADTLQRARLYAATEAGADSVFVPGVTAGDITALVQGQALPLNVMARPNVPQQAWAAARLAGAAFLATGSTPALFDGAAAYGDISSLFT